MQIDAGDSSSANSWADTPTVDSKAVASMAPIFKQDVGRPPDPRRIRLGWYDSIEEALQHLVYGIEDSS